MRSTALFAVVGMVALFAGGACSHNPESFCHDWVESTCQAIAGCCQDGESYDLNECRINLSKECQQVTDVDRVQDGERKFDNGAANDCFGTIVSCADYSNAMGGTQTYARNKACGNVVTGFRPVGAACGGSSDCQKSGDYATCYDGNAGAASGICAKVVLDPAGCSFSFATGELHVCPDGTFCDRGSYTPTSTDPPSVQGFEFRAGCVPFLGAGEDCTGTAGQTIPCAAGLYCDQTGPGMAVCSPELVEGDNCQSHPGGCAAGLQCEPNAGGTGETCQRVGAVGSFCFMPVANQCGDGTCQPPENQVTCPQDCGTGTCGDGICQTGEGATCAQDCCGDGVCEPGENNLNCPGDCP